jgi:hypothetical protein
MSERKLPDISGRHVTIGTCWGHVVSCTDEDLVVKIHPAPTAEKNRIVEIKRTDPGWALKYPRPSDEGAT